MGEVGPAILKARELNAAGTACLIQVMANVEDRRALPLPHFLLFDDSSAEMRDIVLSLLQSVWVVMSGSNNFKFADGVDALALGYGQTKASKL